MYDALICHILSYLIMKKRNEHFQMLANESADSIAFIIELHTHKTRN